MFFEKSLKIMVMGLKLAEIGEPEDLFPSQGAESSSVARGSAPATSKRKLLKPALPTATPTPSSEWRRKRLCRFDDPPSTMKVMKSERSKTLSYSVFYEQAREGGYVAFVPVLPGCHTQGETLEETERNVKEAIAVYLESLAAHGDAIPVEGPSFQGRVTVPA